jgi:N-acetylmuramoyl-L-alanine amidase
MVMIENQYAQILAVFFVGISGGMLFATPQAHPKIDKIFHHQAKPDALELGKIVLYFSALPEVKVITAPNKNGLHTVKFLLPGAQMTSAAQDMLNRCTKDLGMPYRMSLTQDANGMVLALSYDPDKVTSAYESFTAIDLHKGLVFRLYNKELLDTLNAQKNPVMLRMAHAKPSVVIDFGHGGSDSGTVGLHGLKEKDVVMDVGLLLTKLLRDKGFDVLLTRDSDATCALDERTTFANCNDADIFVSIHANSASKATASGIETFCLSPDLLKTGVSFVDSASKHSISCMLASQCKKSMQLAEHVHVSTLHKAKKKHIAVVNRGIKHDVAQVLLGTSMPAILIELGFLSNPVEAQLLNAMSYKQLLAQGICNGIVEFIRPSDCRA